MCEHFLTKDFLAGGMAVVDQSPWYHGLGFLPVGVCEGLCLQNVCDIGKFHTGYFKQSEVCAEMAYWIDVIRVSSHVKVDGLWKQTF